MGTKLDPRWPPTVLPICNAVRPNMTGTKKSNRRECGAWIQAIAAVYLWTRIQVPAGTFFKYPLTGSPN